MAFHPLKLSSHILYLTGFFGLIASGQSLYKDSLDVYANKPKRDNHGFNIQDGVPRAPPAASSAVISPQLVLMVISRPEALHERMAIRKTWTPITNSCQIKIIFAVNGKFKLQELTTAIKTEKQEFNDIIQFENLKDDYYQTLNLVYSALYWARKTYPLAQYIGKANDDVWINFPKIIDLLQRPAPGKDFILGHFIDVTTPAAKELYEAFIMLSKKPLKFAAGHLWITPVQTLDKMLEIGQRLPARSYVGDIELTGQYRVNGGIVMGNIEDYVNLWDLAGGVGCGMANYTLVHGVFSGQKYELATLSCLNNLKCSPVF